MAAFRYVGGASATALAVWTGGDPRSSLTKSVRGDARDAIVLARACPLGGVRGTQLWLGGIAAGAARGAGCRACSGLMSVSTARAKQQSQL